MIRSVIAAPMVANGPANLSGGSQASAIIQEGCNVLNGTVVGAVLGGVICPVGGAEVGAALGGWIGSKLTEDSTPASK
ncbi:MAG: hypothetical protein R3B90_00010 [Planctomycetaceae bacterium]